MPTRTTPFAPGTPCWVDLLTSDLPGAKAFYGALFGWAFEDTPAEYGGYVRVTSDGHAVAGMMGNTPESGSQDVWTTYLATADAAATTAAATAAGATVYAEPMTVGTLGAMAVFGHQAAGMFGIWEAAEHTGFGKYNEANSVSWDELHTRDFAGALEFLATTFGWTAAITGDTDEFRYAIGQVDGNDVAGVMDATAFLPAETPSMWALYFNVEDIDAVLARAVELGATVVLPAEDTPFGRLAELRDPTGAGFKLIQNIAPPA
jgi:predicted enzyme related to lactoylglutathione lyase